MKIDKDTIIEFLKKQGGHGKADQARDELPSQVDTEEDAGLLDRLGIDVGDLLAVIKSGDLGNIGGTLGGFLK
jgi:hypothetical protein